MAILKNRELNPLMKVIKKIINDECGDLFVTLTLVYNEINEFVLKENIDIIYVVDYVLYNNLKLLSILDIIYGEILLDNNDYISKSVEFMFVFERYSLIRGLELKTDIFFLSDELDSDRDNSSISYYFNEIRNGHYYTKAEEYLMFEKIRSGDLVAKENFLFNNLKLVIAIARKHVGYGLSFEDLIQEGNLGLISAIDKFDHKKGYKFSTYASWWIRQGVLRAIHYYGSDIRMPVNIHEDLAVYKKIKKQLMDKLGFEPNAKMIADKSKFTYKKVIKLQSLLVHNLRLDEPIDEDGKLTLSSIVEDKSAINEYDEVLENLTVDQLLNGTSNLDSKAILILRMTFGLKPFDRTYTSSEIGKMYGISKQAAHQLIQRIIMQLRKNDEFIKFALEMGIGRDKDKDDFVNTRAHHGDVQIKFEDYIPNISRESFAAKFTKHLEMFQRAFGANLDGDFDKTKHDSPFLRALSKSRYYINSTVASELKYALENKLTLVDILNISDFKLINMLVLSSSEEEVELFEKVFGNEFNLLSDYGNVDVRQRNKILNRIAEIQEILVKYGAFNSDDLVTNFISWEEECNMSRRLELNNY